jgi:hypothetical protein
MERGPMLLESWQIQRVVSFLRCIVHMVHAPSPRMTPPRVTEMITLYEPVAMLRAEASYGGAVRLEVTTMEGASTAMSFWALQTLLWWDPQRLRAVAPLVPCLGFMVYAPDELLAWDVRSLVCALASDRVWRQRLFDALGMRTRGPKVLQARRRAALRRLTPEEQGIVLWDVITRDVWEPPERKRVPLSGLLHIGGHAFASGERKEPYRLLRYLDNRLGLDRQTPIVERDLSKHGHHVYDRAAVPAPSLSFEAYLHDLTAGLPPQERRAVQLWVQVKEAGLTLAAYCRQHELNLGTYQRAATRGLTRLREKS